LHVFLELSISGPIAFEEYRAIEDWKSHLKNGLDLKQGQVVEVIEKQETGKIACVVADREGIELRLFAMHARLNRRKSSD